MPPTIAQLDAFVSSSAYDAQTAGLIASMIPALKAAGQPGELISPGVRRIRGNLCNVHGRYGPCDKALSGKKPKGGKRAPRGKKPPADKAAQRQANIDSVAKQMAENDAGLSPSGSKALTAFAKGTQPDAATGAGLAQMGLAEQAADGSYRMTPTGRAVVGAMAAGDYQRAVDGVSRATDQHAARTTRQSAAQARAADVAKRRQDAVGKRVAAQIGAAFPKRKPAKAKPAKAKPAKAKPEPAAAKPARAAFTPPPPRRGTASASTGGGSGGSARPKPPAPIKAPAPTKAPAKQIAPALTEAATALSEGADVTDAQVLDLVRNGLVKLNKDGTPVLTAAGQRATMKAFRVFKDAHGQHRWVAQSSTAYQDRDHEIVSTKALADDCVFADSTGSYGPLRWWHTPGLDLGDCDFNAMSGRVLIESGTFRSAAIAQKVAQATAGLEISLGFLHLSSEPDADGVFHHIRRFERSLVPRGKASNRFTAFTVKERPMLDETKKAALKSLGFSDDDIAGLQAQAQATEKSATDQGVAYKADEPDMIINGVTYKAFPVKADAAPMPDNAEEDALDGGADDAEEEAPADENALTLSAGDMAAIGELINGAISQIMGGLNLEKKVADHVQGLLAPMATKEATLTTQVAELTTQLKELTGDQPSAPYRATGARDTLLTDAAMLAAVKQATDQNNNDPWADIKVGLGIQRST